MKLIFLGPPGAGKGTQAKIISKEFNLQHISTGDIFRENIKNKTTLGLEAMKYINDGNLVPDEVTNNMVKERLSRPDCSKGFILDGYPRTIPQADFLGTIHDIDKVINFELSESEVIKRISGRRTCLACGKMYHMVFNPPKNDETCECGNKLVQREDDKPKSVTQRLKVYHNQTEPLINYYTKNGKIINVDASPKIEKITKEVRKVLNL